MVGCITDKKWEVGIGQRDSGKGVLITLMHVAFDKYIKVTNTENFIHKPNMSQDIAKSQSWMLGMEFVRLAYSNEVVMDSQNKVKINGNICKRMASGGDQIEARRNHRDEISFFMQATLLILCNDFPECTPSDCMENVVLFEFPSKFVDAEKLNCKKRKRNNTCQLYLKNNNLKKICSEQLVDAWILNILVLNWTSESAPIPDSTKLCEDFKVKDDDKFFDLFEITQDKSDVISVTRVTEMVRNAGIAVSNYGYGKWLKGAGCIKIKTSRQYIWTGLKEVNDDSMCL